MIKMNKPYEKEETGEKRSVSFRREKPRRTIDYRAYFMMGICFLPLGISLSIVISVGFLGMTALGIIYLIIGLANRDKWGKQVEVAPTTAKTIMLAVIGLIIALVFGLIFFLFRLII